MNSSKPLLTISLLISNRPDTIPRCLDSLRSIRDAIPSELILIDTSNNDEIHKMLLTYTDLVYKFEWCNDFAKARNEGIRRAKGKWFLYLDDDEWFIDTQGVIDFFITGEYQQYGSANLQIRNYSRPDYTAFSDGWVTRLFALDNGVRFEGKVHEYIYNLEGQQLFSSTMIHHSGYAFKSEAERVAHFERNTKMLLKLVEDEPEDLRWQAQMVQEYYTIDKWEEIIGFCEERIQIRRDMQNYMERNHFCTLYAALADAYQNLGRYEEFYEVCEMAVQDLRSTHMLKALLNLRKAEVATEQENYDVAKKEIRAYWDAYADSKTNASRTKEEAGALLINRTFEKNYLDTAYNIQFYIDLKEGKKDALSNLVEHIEQDSEGFTISVKLIRYLIDLMIINRDINPFVRILNVALSDDTMCQLFCGEVQRIEETDYKTFSKIASIYGSTSSDFWYIGYCGLVHAAGQKNRKAIEVALREMLPKMQNAFLLPENAYKIIKHNAINIGKLWAEILGEKWVVTLQEFFYNCDDQAVNSVRQLLEDGFEPGDWHRETIEALFLEKRVIIGVQMRVLDYYELLKKYSICKVQSYCDFCDAYGIEADIPTDVQAALKIYEYTELETQDVKAALGRLKDAVNLNPLLARGVAQFFHFYGDLAKQRDCKKKDEMRALRDQVVSEVYEMLESGKNEDALGVVAQLKQMFPGDLTVAELALLVRLEAVK